MIFFRGGIYLHRVKHNIFFTTLLLLIFIFPTISEALSMKSNIESSKSSLKLGQKYQAELDKCVDGDTAHFKINGKTYKTRFLYIDTPESTSKVEPYGLEASEYTCSFLKQGQIILETDGSTIFDKYERLLAWVWVDGKLHQEEITKAGLVKKFYDYGDYLYEDRIVSAMNDAKQSRRGIYSIEQISKSAEQPTKPSSTIINSNDKEAINTYVKNTNLEDNHNNSIVSVIAAFIAIGLLFSLSKKKRRRR